MIRKMILNKRHVATFAIPFFFATATQAAGNPECAHLAPEYPAKPITLIVGFPPGGPTGQIARLVGDSLGATLSQSVVVDNRGGAGGSIGAAAAARAPADGYTLYLATLGTHAVNASLYTNLAYDHLEDFTGVAHITTTPNVFVTRAESPVRSIDELIAAAKEGNVDMGLPGNGTSPHLSSALLENMSSASVTNIMYKGAGPMLADLLGGHVEFAVDSITTSLPHINSGAFRALGVTSGTRSPQLPDVPTIAESVAGYQVDPWWGVVAPRGTPTPVVERLNCEINHMLESPELVDRFMAMGANVKTMTAEEFSTYIQEETVKWAEVVKTAQISID